MIAGPAAPGGGRSRRLAGPGGSGPDRNRPRSSASTVTVSWGWRMSTVARCGGAICPITVRPGPALVTSRSMVIPPTAKDTRRWSAGPRTSVAASASSSESYTSSAISASMSRHAKASTAAWRSWAGTGSRSAANRLSSASSSSSGSRMSVSVGAGTTSIRGGSPVRDTCHLLAEPLQAPRPGGADATERQIERRSDLRVARRGRCHQDPQQLAAPGGQPIQRPPHQGGPVRVFPFLLGGEHGLLGGVARDRSEVEPVHVAGRQGPAGRAQGLQALAPGGGREPGAYPVGMVDPPDVLGQAQPGGLVDVGGVGVAEPVCPGNRPHQAAEPVHETAPGNLIATGRAAYQLTGIVRVHRHALPSAAALPRRPVSTSAAACDPVAAVTGVTRPQDGAYPRDVLRTRLSPGRCCRPCATVW